VAQRSEHDGRRKTDIKGPLVISVVLAVVAFVLGFLVIFVANTATNGEGPDVPAVAAAALDAAPAP